MTASINASTTAGVVVTSDTSGSLALQTAGTTAVTLDTNQNMGLGVTPSAWYSTYKALQIGATTSLSNAGSGADTILGCNTYTNSIGTQTYIISSYATNYEQYSGKHMWFTAPSGTAGNAISFTQAMTLDASGRLMIGNTGNSYIFSVQQNSTQMWTDCQSTYVEQSLVSSSGTNIDYYLSTKGTGNIIWRQNGTTERARIDSSGNLLVGTTTATATGLTVSKATSSNNGVGYFYNTNNASGDYCVNFALGSNTNNTSSFFLNCTEPGTANKFAIYGNGTYATLSDATLKKNIESTRDGYLQDLMKIRIVKYNWTSQQDGDQKELGLIAQELQQVFPRMVQETTEEVSGKTHLQVKSSVFPYMLIKAIQELNTLVTAQAAQITALNAKVGITS
jgi:hypothetical protein